PAAPGPRRRLGRPGTRSTIVRAALPRLVRRSSRPTPEGTEMLGGDRLPFAPTVTRTSTCAPWEAAGAPAPWLLVRVVFGTSGGALVLEVVVVAAGAALSVDCAGAAVVVPDAALLWVDADTAPL